MGMGDDTPGEGDGSGGIDDPAATAGPQDFLARGIRATVRADRTMVLKQVQRHPIQTVGRFLTCYFPNSCNS